LKGEAPFELPGASIVSAGHFPNAATDHSFLVGLFALALASLSCRLSAGAIGPAVAVHFGYDLTLVLIAIVSGAMR
jgi:hypothetical protein